MTLDWSSIRAWAQVGATLTGAAMWTIVLFCLAANALAWLWHEFLAAAGKALREKERRKFERARSVG